MGIAGAQGFATPSASLLECLHPGDAPVPAVDFEAADIRPCHGIAPCRGAYSSRAPCAALLARWSVAGV